MASFATGHYPAPRGFSYATREPRSGEKAKISGYVGLESHFHVDASCQTRQIDIYKRDSNGNLAITRPLGITNQMNQSY